MNATVAHHSPQHSIGINVIDTYISYPVDSLENNLFAGICKFVIFVIILLI